MKVLASITQPSSGLPAGGLLRMANGEWNSLWRAGCVGDGILEDSRLGCAPIRAIRAISGQFFLFSLFPNNQ